MKVDISIIIPTYNVEKYIEDALSSIANQTFKGSLEVLVIDDCSTDRTVEIVQEFQRTHTDCPIQLLIQPKNMRQGTARNRGIDEANGRYLFFLDGDDILDENALEVMFRKGEDTKSDFVFCDWVYYHEDKGLVYVNRDTFLKKELLIGDECEELLESSPYFTVHKLYRTSFLRDNNIRYGEGYIYEDYEFYVETSVKANIVAIVPNPFYRVRVNEDSTTKSGRKTSLHVDSLLQAIQHTLDKFEPRRESSYYLLFRYLIRKTFHYARFRAPLGHKRNTIKQVVSLLNKKKRDYPVPQKIPAFYHYCFKKRWVQDSKINQLMVLEILDGRGVLHPLFSSALIAKKMILDNEAVRHFKRKKKMGETVKLNASMNEIPLKEKTILFLGFDFRYVGNSKYLFDHLKEHNASGYSLFFATKDESVPSEFRVEPKSQSFYRLLAESKVVVAESWVPLNFQKKNGQIWLQLWHGTPYKKLFFDSNEPFILKSNRNHKQQKFQDIQKWDYLLADSAVGKEKLSSAFVLPEKKILPFGYPRVQWLKDHQHDTQLKNSIRERLGIPLDKKVVLYVPTWRDYNHQSKHPDFSYLLNRDKMSEQLGESYLFIDKEHSYGAKTNSQKEKEYKETETQEFLLIADIVVSDYSSIIFDAMAIDTPFFLYINDYERYKEARGVYEDIHQQLLPFCVHDTEQLVKSIQKTDTCYPYESYKKAKPLLSFTSEQNAFHLLQDTIDTVMRKK